MWVSRRVPFHLHSSWTLSVSDDLWNYQGLSSLLSSLRTCQAWTYDWKKTPKMGPPAMYQSWCKKSYSKEKIVRWTTQVVTSDRDLAGNFGDSWMISGPLFVDPKWFYKNGSRERLQRVQMNFAVKWHPIEPQLETYRQKSGWPLATAKKVGVYNWDRKKLNDRHGCDIWLHPWLALTALTVRLLLGLENLRIKSWGNVSFKDLDPLENGCLAGHPDAFHWERWEPGFLKKRPIYL